MSLKDSLRQKWIAEFNDGDPSPLNHVKEQLDESALMADLTNFTAAYPRFSKNLFSISGQVESWHRLGKGEILIYFLYDDVDLGGHSSSVDIHIDGQPLIEVKCAKREGGDKYAHFMLGIDEVPASLKFFMSLLSLFEKMETAGKIIMPERYVNITRLQLDALHDVAPKEYAKLEKKYLKELLSSKVGQKKYIFFDTELGLPFFFGYFTHESLKIDRVSGGLTRLWFAPEGFTE